VSIPEEKKDSPKSGSRNPEGEENRLAEGRITTIPRKVSPWRPENRAAVGQDVNREKIAPTLRPAMRGNLSSAQRLAEELLTIQIRRGILFCMNTK